MSHQRRHRSVHAPPAARWAGRVGCAVAIGGVVVLGLCRPPPVYVEAPDDPGPCPALEVVSAVALYDRVAPPGANPDLEAFVTSLNVELGTVRRQIKESCHR